MAFNLTSDKEVSRSDSSSEEDTGYHSANLLFEYQWPPHDTFSETFMLQEQVVEYLEVRGFSRKYPDLYRRPLEVEEREFLVDLGAVTETQSNLGLVALRSEDVYQLMYEDYSSKFKEYMSVLEQRLYAASLQQIKEETEALTKKQIVRKQLNSYGVQDLVKQAAEFNSTVSKDRAKRVFLSDVHPAAHWIRGKLFLNEQQEEGHPSLQHSQYAYPVSILQGQYSDTVQGYAPKELKHLPVNTVIASLPPPSLCVVQASADHSAARNVESSGKEQCSGDIIIEGTDLTEQLADSANIGTLDSILVKKKSSLMLQHQQCSVAALCVICRKSKGVNSLGCPEELLQCSKCYSSCHSSCLGFDSRCLSAIKAYPWECNECKLCWICDKAEDDEKVILCDVCDRGFHIFCVGLDSVPCGRWLCDFCVTKR